MDTRPILVAVDFDRTSEHALELAATLAKQLGASLTIVHAYDPQTLGSTMPPELLLEMRPRILEGAGRELERMMKPFEGSGVRMKSLVVEGDPENRILATAADEKAQLIVVGTHSRRAIWRALLGSVAADVMRDAPVPVMIVPSKGR